MISIEVLTDKIRYMLGESVLIFGTVNTNDSKPPVEKVIVQVSYLSNSTEVQKLPDSLSWLYNIIGEQPSSNTNKKWFFFRKCIRYWELRDVCGFCYFSKVKGIFTDHV